MKLTTLGLGLLMSATAVQADLRPLAADRPDATESPQTVDQGHWQIEVSILGFAQDKQDNLESRSVEAFNTNLKYGLTHSVDLQFVMTAYLEEEAEKNNTTTSQSGHSDLEIRSKINLWGNDAGHNAFALLPYIKLPTGEHSNDKVEGGLIVTYGTEISGMGVGFQGQVDSVYNEIEDKMELASSYTAVLGYDITQQAGGYLEYIGEYDTEGDYFPYASFGLTYQTHANQQWDIGSKVALSEAGQDFELFFGATQRY